MCARAVAQNKLSLTILYSFVPRRFLPHCEEMNLHCSGAVCLKLEELCEKLSHLPKDHTAWYGADSQFCIDYVKYTIHPLTWCFYPPPSGTRAVLQPTVGAGGPWLQSTTTPAAPGCGVQPPHLPPPNSLSLVRVTRSKVTNRLSFCNLVSSHNLLQWHGHRWQCCGRAWIPECTCFAIAANCWRTSIGEGLNSCCNLLQIVSPTLKILK